MIKQNTKLGNQNPWIPGLLKQQFLSYDDEKVSCKDVHTEEWG